jgi:hexosaminidase
VDLSTPLAGAEIRYTLDGTAPTLQSEVYADPVAVETSGKLTAQAFELGEAVGRPAAVDFNWHKAVGKKISIENDPHPKYNAGGAGALINGVMGASERYGDAEWLGFSGDDLIATIDLGESQEVKQIAFRFFYGPGQWIYLPAKVEISLSEDGQTFDLANSQNIDTFSDQKVYGTAVPVNGTGRYLKVHVYNYGIIPEGSVGAGNGAWLFVDELVVE